MAHVVDNGKDYFDLTDKYNNGLISVTNQESFCKVLNSLLTESEAELALLIPTTFISYKKLRARTNIDEEVFLATLKSLANKGIVFDIEKVDSRYYSLSPIVIGFFEFSLMRKDLADNREFIVRSFDEYMDNSFFEELFSSTTSYNRVILSGGLNAEDTTQIKSYQSANQIIDEAYSIAVSICACRHHKAHLGRGCKHEEENCISLNYAADYLIRNNLAREIDKSEAKEIVCISAKNGLVQTVDNVKKLPGYICNCCSCCCGMISGITKYGFSRSVASSGYSPQISTNNCSGCGLCVQICPLNAIKTTDNKIVTVDYDICFGCGVCATRCKKDAISMISDGVKLIIPETIIEKNILMALEKGKLIELIFSDIAKVDTKVIKRILGITGIAGFARIIGSFAPVRSIFLKSLTYSFKRKYADLKGVIY